MNMSRQSVGLVLAMFAGLGLISSLNIQQSLDVNDAYIAPPSAYAAP